MGASWCNIKSWELMMAYHMSWQHMIGWQASCIATMPSLLPDSATSLVRQHACLSILVHVSCTDTSRLSLKIWATTQVAIHKKFLNLGKQHWTWLALKDVNGSLLCHIPQHQILCLFAVAQKDPTSSRKCIHTFQMAKWGRHIQAPTVPPKRLVTRDGWLMPGTCYYCHLSK